MIKVLSYFEIHRRTRFSKRLKVSKFQNEVMKSSFLPKYEPKIVRIPAQPCSVSQFKADILTIFGLLIFRYYFDQESTLWKLKFQGFWKDFPVIFMKFWIRMISWPNRISNKFSIGKVYHMFVRVASYYSYYEQQHKCDILNADQKSPNHIDLELEIYLKECLFNFEAQLKYLFLVYV